MTIRQIIAAVALLAAFGAASSASTASAPAGSVRLKDVARIAGVRPQALTGYGIVTGLAGTGDSSRNKSTLQSIANVIAQFGVRVGASDIASRNVAAVVVSATLPPYAEAGHPLDVQVSSLGDARSLSGGVLLLTPLYGPDERLYALAKGSLLVGGHQFEAPGASTQRNYPTAGRIANGATVERAADEPVAAIGEPIDVLLDEPDFSSAQQIAEALNRQLPGTRARALNAGKVRVEYPGELDDRVALIAQIERTEVQVDMRARVVVDERTGTVVSGETVRLGGVSLSHGELRVEITTRYQVSQPDGVLVRPGPGIATAVVPESEIDVKEPTANLVRVPEGATVAELVAALRSIKLSTRDVIAVLQAVKSAGALHGELIIQ